MKLRQKILSGKPAFLHSYGLLGVALVKAIAAVVSGAVGSHAESSTTGIRPQGCLYRQTLVSTRSRRLRAGRPASVRLWPVLAERNEN